LAGDTVLTVVAALFATAHLLVVGAGPGPRPGSGPRPGPAQGWPEPGALVLAVLCASSLLVRSRWPIGSLLAVGAFGTVYLAAGNRFLAILPTVLIALYSAVAYSGLPRLKVWGIAVGVAVALTLAHLFGDFDFPRHATGILLDAGWMVIAMLLGDTLRSRRLFAHEAELRALEAEHTREEAAQRRVVEERLQIARDLHDILAHTVALINVQAGVAAHVIDKQPEQAREALNTIKAASRDTLQELRALVGVLRDGGDGSAPLAPAPTLDRLDDLIEAVRDAGLDVTVEVARPAGRLPATVDVAAYRILQEALTNVIKHAGAATVQVSVRQTGPELELTVTNSHNGHAAPAMLEGTGHGIPGMRERAAAVGGTVQAGPLPDGGFQVRAALPVPGVNA
jgi:signal transduction histidine kinase